MVGKIFSIQVAFFNIQRSVYNKLSFSFKDSEFTKPANWTLALTGYLVGCDFRPYLESSDP